MIALYILLTWVPLITAFSFGTAANHGWNSTLSKMWTPKSPFSMYLQQVIENGYHHFILGLWVMLLSEMFTTGTGEIILYNLGLGLVLSQYTTVMKIIETISNDISKLTFSSN